MIDPFNYSDIQFPKDFLFGAATAGAQVEGSLTTHMDDPAYIHNQRKINPNYVPAGKASDSWHHFKDDLSLLKEMNLKLYRFSIEWARIEPQKEHYDDDAIAQYVNQLKQLKAAGIKVCLTLHHFSHPSWFEDQGAFRTLDNLDDFLRYLNEIVPIVAQYVDFWIILNETNLPFQYTPKERMIALSYHAAAYPLIKRYSDKPVSSSLSYSPKHPFRGSKDRLDVLMADWLDYSENEYFVHAFRTGEVSMPGEDAYVVPGLKNSIDFWAINTYIRQNIDGRKADYRSGQYTATTLPVLDEPFYMNEISPEIMIDIAARFSDKPILITENGFAVKDDDIRIVYISEMLQSIHQAISLGYNIIGYTYWSLIDNWEWGDYGATYGLASIDQDYGRHLKNSGRFYGTIARDNEWRQATLRQFIDYQPRVE